MSKTVHGKCMCGNVKVSFPMEKDHFDACHCGMCRKWGGGPALTVDGGVNVKFEGAENITVYNSSDWAERGFCKNCGTHLFYRLKGNGFTNLPCGLIENSEHLKFHLQIFVDMKPANYSFANKTEEMTQAEVFAKYVSQS